MSRPRKRRLAIFWFVAILTRLSSVYAEHNGLNDNDDDEAIVCKGKTKTISYGQLCDRNFDCPDGSDEGYCSDERYVGLFGVDDGDGDGNIDGDGDGDGDNDDNDDGGDGVIFNPFEGNGDGGWSRPFAPRSDQRGLKTIVEGPCLCFSKRHCSNETCNVCEENEDKILNGDCLTSLNWSNLKEQLNKNILKSLVQFGTWICPNRLYARQQCDSNVKKTLARFEKGLLNGCLFPGFHQCPGGVSMYIVRSFHLLSALVELRNLQFKTDNVYLLSDDKVRCTTRYYPCEDLDGTQVWRQYPMNQTYFQLKPLEQGAKLEFGLVWPQPRSTDQESLAVRLKITEEGKKKRPDIWDLKMTEEEEEGRGGKGEGGQQDRGNRTIWSLIEQTDLREEKNQTWVFEHSDQSTQLNLTVARIGNFVLLEIQQLNISQILPYSKKDNLTLEFVRFQDPGVNVDQIKLKNSSDAHFASGLGQTLLQWSKDLLLSSSMAGRNREGRSGDLCENEDERYCPWRSKKCMSYLKPCLNETHANWDLRKKNVTKLNMSLKANSFQARFLTLMVKGEEGNVTFKALNKQAAQKEDEDQKKETKMLIPILVRKDESAEMNNRLIIQFEKQQPLLLEFPTAIKNATSSNGEDTNQIENVEDNAGEDDGSELLEYGLGIFIDKSGGTTWFYVSYQNDIQPIGQTPGLVNWTNIVFENFDHVYEIRSLGQKLPYSGGEEDDAGDGDGLSDANVDFLESNPALVIALEIVTIVLLCLCLTFLLFKIKQRRNRSRILLDADHHHKTEAANGGAVFYVNSEYDNVDLDMDMDNEDVMFSKTKENAYYDEDVVGGGRKDGDGSDADEDQDEGVIMERIMENDYYDSSMNQEEDEKKKKMEEMMNMLEVVEVVEVVDGEEVVTVVREEGQTIAFKDGDDTQPIYQNM